LIPGIGIATSATVAASLVGANEAAFNNAESALEELIVKYDE
jgi:mevalonate kinase